MKLHQKLYATFAMLSVSASAISIDFSTLESLIKQTKEVANLPSGTAIAVVKDDKIIYEGYFGYADIAKKKKVDANTSFYIASITKPYYALSTLMKEHKGSISESTNLKTLFPKMKFEGFEPDKVTIKHLLSHSMGIDNEPLAMVTAYNGVHDLDTRTALVEKSYINKEAPLNTFEYSNVGYNILSVWEDQTTGKNWQDNLQDLVFFPLANSNTSAYISDASKKNWTLAKPYSVRTGNHEPLYLFKKDDTMHSAGGMISSARDMANFLKVQLNEGMLNGKQIFPKSVIEKSQQKVVDADTKYGDFKRNGYAWGWYIGPYMGETLYHHFGGYPGTHPHLSFMPEKGLGVVILNNEDMLSPKLTGIIAKAIYSNLLGKKEIIAEIENEALSLQKRVKGLSSHLAKQRAKIAKRKWQLSLDKKDYIGSYEHPEYGMVEVKQNSNKDLIVSWGHMHAKATAFTKPDSLRVELIPNRGEVIQFEVDNGVNAGLKYQGVSFKKQ